jgi:hypothetical protein
MRTMVAIAFGCALMIGVNQAASSAMTDLGRQPSTARSSPSLEYKDGADDANQYVCQFSPLCQRASQCEAYCAGGIPVCFQGCCTCAS